MSAVRYIITGNPTGFTGGSLSGGRYVQSGKLNATKTAMSPIVTVPAAQEHEDLTLLIIGAYGDPVGKTDNGYSFLAIANPGSDPAPGGAEQPVDAAPRFLIPPQGQQGLQLVVRPGQRFAIQDSGYPA